MPELRDLLAAEARRQEAAAPAFATIVVRARQRRVRQVVGSVLGVVVVVVAALLGPGLLRADKAAVVVPGKPSVKALPVSPGVYARLREIALSMAKGNGDDHPTEMQAVAVTDVDAADTVLSGDISSSGQVRAGYAIEVRGVFVCGGCSTLAGHALKGTVASSIVVAGSFDGVTFGLGNAWVDLDKLGHAFSLMTPTTAAPVPVVTVAQPVATQAPATESSGPAAPDPKTLAEAVARTKASTLDPATAVIDLAARVTAGRLRVAGVVIPAQVPDSRPMFLVLVDGATIFTKGVATNGARATRFAVVFSTDGSGLGTQAVYHGVFGLPAVQGAPVATPTVVGAASLADGDHLGYTPATGRAPAVTAQAAVAAAGVRAPARPLAALVMISTVHVTARLAWVIQTDCVPVFGSTPAANEHPSVFLETNQVVIDATTGQRLISAAF